MDILFKSKQQRMKNNSDLQNYMLFVLFKIGIDNLLSLYYLLG